jgi:hypothetical protein
LALLGHWYNVADNDPENPEEKDEQETELSRAIPPMTRVQLLNLTMSVEGALAALGAGAVIFLESVPPLEGDLGLWGNLIWTVALTAPVLLLGVITYLKPPPGMRVLRTLLDQIMVHFQALKIRDVAFISIMAGLGEEFFFRGALQTMAIDWLGPVVGILVASLIFGALHALTPAYFVVASLMGIYLGTIYYVTGSLILVILIHAVYDFALLTFILKRFRAR